MSEQNEEQILNPVYPSPVYAALRSLVFIAIAMLLIFVLLPSALAAAAT